MKGHKDIKGNEKADALSKTTSILGHESEGVVTPAGLKAWARRERAIARGGSGLGILGWHRKAISAYTWCATEKGPQKKWLHQVKKADTPACQCQQEQSGEHLAERCSLLAETRETVERNEMREWRTRHSRNQLFDKKKKGPVEPEKEVEVDKLERFFCQLYEFHNPAPNTPVFVFAPPAPVSVLTSASAPVSSASDSVSVTFPTSEFSVVSSAFVAPFAAPVSSPSCIGQTS